MKKSSLFLLLLCFFIVSPALARQTTKIVTSEPASINIEYRNEIELKNELQTLRDDINTLKNAPKGMQFSGNLRADWKFANLLATGGAARGGITNYRLKFSGEQKLSRQAGFRFNLDTMDYGYDNDGAIPNLATRLLDLETDLWFPSGVYIGSDDAVNVKLTYGPGYVQHTADATSMLPSEVGITYFRPYTGILASSKYFGLDVTGGYLVPGQSAAGTIEAGRITLSFGKKLENLAWFNVVKWQVDIDHFSQGIFSATVKETRWALDLYLDMAAKAILATQLKMGGVAGDSMLLGASLTLNDVIDSNTQALLRVTRVGATFIDPTSPLAAAELGVNNFDLFDRPFANDTVNWAAKIVKSVNSRLRLIGKGEIRMDGQGQYTQAMGRLTAEGGISYTVALNALLEASYKVYQDRASSDTTDVATFSLVCDF